MYTWCGKHLTTKGNSRNKMEHTSCTKTINQCFIECQLNIALCHGNNKNFAQNILPYEMNWENYDLLKEFI